MSRVVVMIVALAHSLVGSAFRICDWPPVCRTHAFHFDHDIGTAALVSLINATCPLDDTCCSHVSASVGVMHMRVFAWHSHEHSASCPLTGSQSHAAVVHLILHVCSL